MNFTRILQLNGLKPKNKGHTNFYECCDLTKKVYLKYIYFCKLASNREKSADKKSKLFSVFAKATDMLVAMIIAILLCIPASILGQNAGNNYVYMTNDENI